jgi:hypothetical protein
VAIAGSRVFTRKSSVAELGYHPRMSAAHSDPILELIGAEIGYTVGFLILSRRDGIEDAHPAGSGSLVAVGSTRGILTAAHVLTNLPDRGPVGLVRFPRNACMTQKQTIDMSFSEKLTIAATDFGPDGPDLGFLRLSPTEVGLKGQEDR